MNQEKLIELVREYTFLYDMSHRRYSDKEKRDEAWKEIAKKLHVKNYWDCKKTWNLLRDSFRRAVKKETRSGQAKISKIKWKYEDEMSFLLPYFKEKSSIWNVLPTHVEKGSDTEENYSDADNQAGSVSYEAPIEHRTLSPELPNIKKEIVTQTSNSKETYPISANRIRIRKKRFLQSTSNENSINTILKFILEDKMNTNEVQQFFGSIATTVQSFPPRERAITKAKVFKIVSEMELEILNRNSSDHFEYVSCETQIPE